MIPSNLIESILIDGIPLILAITLHEAAHGYAAKMLGDRTAAFLGRVSLNPLKHIDPVGTILIPLMLKLAGVLVDALDGRRVKLHGEVVGE